MKSLDLDYVRRQFPALADDWVFFDNAGGAQIARPVLDRIHEYLTTSNVQLGASYDVSRVATERVECAVKALAGFVGAAHESEVVLGSSTSMLLRMLASRLVENWQAGDEVIVTNCDHEANIGPWRELEAHGIVVKTWNVRRDSFELELDDLRELLSDRTRLVAFTHVSNVIGTINPVSEIADVAHDAGALVCVDGVAFAPHRRVDLRELNADFYAFSFYKVYGPHYALLYGRHDELAALPRYNHFFIDELPYRLQPGNVNYELSYGMIGFIDYVDELYAAHDGAPTDPDTRYNTVFARFAEHEQELAAPLLSFLDSRADVTIIGSRRPALDKRAPTISFVVDDRKSDDITALVDPHHIGIRYGDFYARRLVDDLGLAERNGVVRVSMVHYNTAEEVHRLIRVLAEILG